ncbi:MAG TPA: YihA family ribosome biogenesis GTP-binding protein, partial [Gammaproteobacteria bacterium]|nr:YihA family ribosome biogenesis GTP-binding protein [Gammaproteobacteria bacterium]
MTTADEPNPLRAARFWRAATALDHLPPDDGAEVAFAGRSNA